MNALKQIMIVVAGIAVFIIIAICMFFGSAVFVGIQQGMASNSDSNSCTETIHAWAQDVKSVLEDGDKMSNYMQEKDYAMASTYAFSAKTRLDKIPSPVCDEDALKAHVKLKSVFTLMYDGLTYAESGNFSMATPKFQSGTKLIREITPLINILQERYPLY